MTAREPPRFFLATDPTGDDPPRLVAEDAEHARRVLRLCAGDPLVGLDGRGGAWPLVVGTGSRRALVLERAGEAVREPAPGQEGAPLPWIEVAVAWPRRARAEEMVGRLVQLGAAAIRPLSAEHAGPTDAERAGGARLERILREAVKQSRRTWLPRLEPATALAELPAQHPGAALALLDPAAGLGLDTWLRSLEPGRADLGSSTRPIVLAVGPEGGVSADEYEQLLTQGASPAALGPHVLRIETAAEAALALAATMLVRRAP